MCQPYFLYYIQTRTHITSTWGVLSDITSITNFTTTNQKLFEKLLWGSRALHAHWHYSQALDNS